MNSLQSFEVMFDLSENVVSKEKLKGQVAEEKQRYSIDTMQID
jgi:hypothetical protein